VRHIEPLSLAVGALHGQEAPATQRLLAPPETGTKAPGVSPTLACR
jgi:hypothetical protein